VNTKKTTLSRVERYRFGPYELDLTRNELRKFGVRLKLEPKPLQLLRALLEHTGEVVTRSELRQLLWGDGVFVDFEKGLTVAVTKLRAALNDSPDTPQYIATVAGEGYEFIAEAERAFASAFCETGSEHNAKAEPIQPSLPAYPTVQPMSSASSPLNDSSTRFHKRRAVEVLEVLTLLVLLAIVGVKTVYKLRGPDPAHPPKVMLVVLPFENLSGDPSLEYLSDGITEELSAQLGNLNPQRLGVIGRTSAMIYKHSPKGIGEIGRELGVSYVVEGSVRREAEKIRVTAQLVEVSDQAHVWSADYDRDIRDLVQLEDDIAREVTGQVGVSVALESPEKLKRHTPTPEAHEAYLVGRYYWNKRTSAGYATAASYFRQAFEKDPQYAAAYAGLAESDGPTPEAKAAALKAVELDPRSGEARTALGFIQLFREVDVVAADKTLQTAIELDPNYATAHHWYAFVLDATGRSAESRAEIAEAAKLDPLSLIIRLALAEALSGAGQQDAALAQVKLVFDMDPHFPKYHETLGHIYERKGMYGAAIHEYELSAQTGGDPLWAERGYLYAISGNKQLALKMLAQLQASQPSAVRIALVNLGLGRKEEAIAWLQKGLLEPDDSWLSIRSDPRFDPLRSDPRFQAFLRHMKLVS
jgi:TolB-like protein/DNA-binding winged helix-turn-helix (wHTH) protein/Tfp pilus assembly protein PilF